MGNERELKLLPLQEINRNELLSRLVQNGYKVEGEINRVKQIHIMILQIEAFIIAKEVLE